MLRLGLGLGLVLSALVATGAHATSVVIVRPANDAQAMVETFSRLRGELTSVGFGTEVVDDPASAGIVGDAPPSQDVLARLGIARRVDAVIAVGGDVARDFVAVWVIDRKTGRSATRQVSFLAPSDRTPHTLAIRALELLRSSFLEIELTIEELRGPTGGGLAAGATSSGQAPSSPGARRYHIGVEAGGVVLTSPDGIGPAFLPTLRLDWAVFGALVAQVSATGLGTRATVRANGGDARVDESAVLLGARYRLREGKRVRPTLALAIGALRTAVEGQADLPNQGQRALRWSFLVDVALGVSMDLDERFFMTLAAHAQLAEPYLAVRFLDTVVATAGRPNLAWSLAFGAWL